MFETETRGEVTVVHMRHGKANAQDVDFCDAFSEQMASIAASDARATVVTGQGGIFSAGVDLLRARAEGPPYLERFLPALRRFLETTFFHPKPMVAAVNGHAIAGGCLLACCADRRLMARGDGRIGVPEVLVGVAFPAIAFEVMRFVCAQEHFEKLVYGGATLAPEDAKALGLVDEVVDADGLVDAAVDAASRLAAIRPEVFALTKRQMRQPVRDKVQALAAHETEVTAVWTAPETLEAIDAYVQSTFKKT